MTIKPDRFEWKEPLSRKVGYIKRKQEEKEAERLLEEELDPIEETDDNAPIIKLQ